MQAQRYTLALCTLLLMQGCAGGQPATQNTEAITAKERRAAVPDEVLVKFKPSTTPERAAELIRSLDTEIIRYTPSLNLYHLRILKRRPMTDMIQEFSRFPEVEYAEPNYSRQINPSAP